MRSYLFLSFLVCLPFANAKIGGDGLIFLKKDRWVEEFRAGFIPEICNKDRYFRQCFKVEEKDCKNRANKALNQVINKTKMPEKIELIVEASSLGIEIGEQVGKLLEVSLSGSKNADEACQVVGEFR